MRIRSVTAHAFGPLPPDVTLDLAEGMTVVIGDNESAKSTWHAAIYAALCGRRRKPRTKEERAAEQRFRDLHRPWDRDGGWAVSAIVQLDDGRRVELRQDLDAAGRSRATDLDLGRDCSPEIVDKQDGTLDAATWLGLSSRSFTTTACVNQAQLALATEHAAGLQEFLDRAVATAGTDETSAAAIKGVDDFKRDHVGTKGYTQALPKAKAAVDAAEAALRQAIEAQQQYEQLSGRVDDLRARAREAKERLDLALAATARHDALAVEARLRNAQQLDRTLCSTPAMLGAQRPEPELAAPRDHPAGDLDAPDVEAAASALQRAEQSLQLHDQNRPQAAPGPAAADSRGDVPRQPGPATNAPAARSVPRLLILAVVLALAAAALLALGVYAGGAALLVVAIAGAGWTLYVRVHGGRIAVEARAVERVTQGLLADQLRQWHEQHDKLAAGRDRQALQLAATLSAHGQAGDVSTVQLDLAAYRQACAERAEHAQQDRGLLRGLLGGGTLADLQASAARAREHAGRLAGGVDPDKLAATAPADEAVLAGLRDRAAYAAEEAGKADGALEQLGRGMVAVADAEEDLATARANLDRLHDLGSILDRTREFLVEAQEQVQREIAPALAATLRTRLATVTGGRYTDAAVNPQTLKVKVYDPRRHEREADLLSHGTAEQVYLLLRLAMVERLTAGHDTCPLLLDDVTVHADATRTARILDLLLDVAARRQVVLFTQEQQVADWARHHLAAPRHAIHALAPVAAS